MTATQTFRALLLCPFLMLLVHQVRAQTKIITGKILDEQNQPVKDASVLLKGSAKGVSTGRLGEFSITVPSAAKTLLVSYVGYTEQEADISTSNFITVNLKPESASLGDVVVIGYGTARKKDITGAVARVSSKTYRDQPMTQLTDMLTGTVAGFNTTQNSAAAGGSSLQIRGPKSLNASTEPMIVLDGSIFNGSIADINPADIETIDILKDASSAAVFGARSAAGVLMITTKKGAQGKPVITVSATSGVASPTHALKPYDKNGYLDFRRDALIGYQTGQPDFYFYNPTALPAGVTIDQWRNASPTTQPDNTKEWLSRLRFYPIEIDNYLAGKSVDWYDEVIHPGLRQNYDLGVSGATDKANYYWSMGYTNNEGVIRGDKFSSIRSRLNFDLKVASWMNIGINSQFASRDESAVPASLYDMYYVSPYGSKYEANGSLKWYPNDYAAVASPLIDYTGQQKMRRNNALFASIYAKIKLPFGFDYKISYQPRIESLKDYNFWSSSTITGGSLHANGYGSRADSSRYEWILDNILHWGKKLGEHEFDLTLLYSAEKGNKWSSLATNENFSPNQNLGYNALQLGTNPTLYNYDEQITGDAVMGRLNYTFKGKYLFTGSVRRDGYSAFGKKNPRAVFPAAAFAWKISDEKFFKVPWISQMKLRASWGINGNRAIGAYSALAQITPNTYYNGSNVQIGVYNTSLANFNLVWEKTKSINVGVDIGLFKNRIELSAEYYDMSTTDLLVNRQLPILTGFTNITTNLGELANKGFELSLSSTNITNSRFSWRSNFIFSFNRNKIKRLFGDFETVNVNGKSVTREVADYTNEWFPGQSLDRVWNYKINGIWQTSEAAKAAVYGEQPGDFKATDADNNGLYEALVDKAFIGYRQPRYRFGLRNEFTFLKNFSASIFIRADLGHMAAFDQALNPNPETFDKRNKVNIPYWTTANGNNEWARLNTNITSFGGGIAIYKPRSFVRIQDVTLSYTVPQSVSQKARISNARIFAAVRNLYAFDNWPGWDPESGDTPMPRTISAGISFSL